jgi:hypothetical protein
VKDFVTSLHSLQHRFGHPASVCHRGIDQVRRDAMGPGSDAADIVRLT